jgi:hypothetical protein
MSPDRTNDMSSEKDEVIAEIGWAIGVVSTGNARFSLGYCSKGGGVFKIIPSGRRAGWVYGLYPLVVTDVRKRKGECEFAKSCFVFSCPLNKATYDSIVEEYKHMGVKTAEEAKRLVELAKRLFEEFAKMYPKEKDLLHKGYNVAFKHAPLRLRTSSRQ